MLSQGGRGGAAEDARGAAAARRVRARHHRPAEGQRHDPQPHPAPAVPPAAAPTTLAEHVRWVAADAGLDVDDAAIDAGARPGRRLGPRHAVGARADRQRRRRRRRRAVVRRVRRGADRPRSGPRAHGDGPRRQRRPRAAGARRGARAPPPQRVPLADGARAGAAARRTRSTRSPRRPSALGPAALVRAIERLGEILVEMRHAPDPRVLVEVALVQLTQRAGGRPATTSAPLAARRRRARAGARRRPRAGAAPRRAGRPGDRPHRARRAGPARRPTPPAPIAAARPPAAPRRRRPHRRTGRRRRDAAADAVGAADVRARVGRSSSRR